MRRLSYLFLLLSLVLPVYAQTAVADPLDRNLRKHIEYLASEKLEGRRTGEAGAALAADYVAGQFKKLRLKTSRGKSFFQSFPYVTGVERGAGNEFNLYVPNSGPKLRVDARPAGFSPNAVIARTPVVFAGFGIVSAEQNRDDYAGVDAKGKIVLVMDGNPENDNPHSLLGRFDARTKALIARDKGAVALLIISRETDIDADRLARMTFDQTLGESALPTIVVPRSAAATILGISEVQLANAESGKFRPDGAKALAAADLRIELTKKTSEARNVIGVLPGTDPVLKNEAIVIGAHYDHLGRGGQGSLDINSKEVHHGADDNASGVAALLELARYLSNQKANKRTIIFMAFSGEEEGLLGSKYYVNNPLWPIEKTVAMINLDMVGRLKDDKLNIGGVGTASEWKKIIDDSRWARPQGDSAPFDFKFQLNDDGFGPSDHSSFYGKKIPVLFFFTGTHNDYHKPSDTAEKINYRGLYAIAEYVINIVNAIDRNAQRPTYTVARSSGMGGGRTGFNISLGTVPSYADSSDGLVIDGVRDNSPAAKAGIKVGDKIVKLAGKDIRNAMDYTYVLGEMKAGQEYEVIVIRGGERLTLTIVPVKR